MLTYEDCVQHAQDYLGVAHPDDPALLRDCKKAVEAAYRELGQVVRWTYYQAAVRVRYFGSYVGDGTDVAVAYEHAGPTPRLATLSGGTWPDWAAGAWLRVGELGHRVLARLSGTQLQLHPTLNPGEDFAAAAFTLLRDTYPLPDDFLELADGYGGTGPEYVAYGDPALALASWRRQDSGEPCRFAVISDDLRPGRQALRLIPSPEESGSIDFPYRRQPRPLGRVYREAAGRVAATGGSSAVTGTGTAFTQAMVGAVLRVSGDPAKDPTGHLGDNHPAWEAVVLSVASATALVASEMAPATLGPARFTISDRIDINEPVMGTLMLRGIEKHLASVRVLQDRPNAFAQWKMEKDRARDADAPSYGVRAVGWGPRRPSWYDRKGDLSVFTAEE